MWIKLIQAQKCLAFPKDNSKMNNNTQHCPHTCKCGCGGQIEIKIWHKYDGIPKYIKGHNKPNLKHGKTYTKLYRVWNSMKQRILNSNTPYYKNYGGRGINICDEWLEFIPFRDWSLNNGYKEGLQINRIKNEFGYSPENCDFIPAKENTRNRRGQKIKNIEIANEIRDLYKTGNYTQQQLADKFNVSREIISQIILNKKWKN